MIKVKGFRIAPAELEAVLLKHPAVADCAVIGVPGDGQDELPKAYVVRAEGATNQDPSALEKEIVEHVKKNVPAHMLLQGGVEFIDAVPKSLGGKVLRRVLREKEQENGR